MNYSVEVERLNGYIQLLDSIMPLVSRFQRTWWDGCLGCEAAYIGPGPDDFEALHGIDGPYCDDLLKLEAEVCSILKRVSSDEFKLFHEASSLSGRQTIAIRVRDCFGAQGNSVGP